MKNVITSMYAQLIYMMGMGVGFLFLPHLVLPLFGFADTSEVWIRVLGALVLGVAGGGEARHGVLDAGFSMQ